MEGEVVVLLRVVDLEDEPLAADLAGVADLAAALAVERRPVEDQDDRRPGVADADRRRVGQAVLRQDADDLRARPRSSA